MEEGCEWSSSKTARDLLYDMLKDLERIQGISLSVSIINDKEKLGRVSSRVWIAFTCQSDDLKYLHKPRGLNSNGDTWVGLPDAMTACRL